MDEADLRDEIVRLEVQIEELAEANETCRKIDLAAKMILAVGGLIGLMLLAGAINFTPFVMVGSIAAVLGGIVLVGSNKRTWEQTGGAMRSTERRREQLISTLKLRSIEGS